jgi:hypothetical protein
MNWTTMLARQVEGAYRAADGLMALVDEGQLGWKPDAPRGEGATGWMTTGQLLRHLTEACGVLCRAFADNDWSFMGPPPEAGKTPPPMPSARSVKEAREALARDKEVALATIREAGEARLQNERVTAPWGIEGTLGEQFLDMVKHLESHKNQLFYYLKLQGRAVNTAHLWGMA